MGRTLLVMAALAAATLLVGVVWDARQGRSAPGPPSEASRLVLDGEGELGRVEARSIHDVVVRYAVRGQATLRVLEQSSTCSCLQLETFPSLLKAGATGAVRIRLRVPGGPGPFQARLRIVLTCSPPHDVVDFVFSGAVAQTSAVRPGQLALRTQRVGEAVRRRLAVRVLGASVPRAPGGDTILCRLEGIRGSVEVAPPLDGASRGASLTATLHMPGRPGPLHAWLHVRLPDEGWVRVPITARVVSGPRLTRGGSTGPASPHPTSSKPLSTGPGGAVENGGHGERSSRER